MRREGCPAARLFAACGVAWADAMGGACLLGRERAGAVARLPRAANRRGCGRCELLPLWVLPRLRAVLAGARPRGSWKEAVNACGGGTLWRGERAPGAYGLKRVIGAGCRRVARTSSMRLRRVIWLGVLGVPAAHGAGLAATKVS